MSALITMPRMGETMESGRITAWLKQPGDRFERGEILLEIETDKVTVEMPALDSGRLVEILAAEGAEIAVGAPIGRYDAGTTTGAAVPAAPAAWASEPPADQVAVAPAESGRSPDLVHLEPAGRVRATPVARRLARRAGLDLAALAGTGRRGRVMGRDVEAALTAAPSAVTAQPSLPELQLVALPQGRMAYREWQPATAARRTVLLLHGFGADSATWGTLAAALARAGMRVVAPDLPGHGATAIEAGDVDALVDAALAFAAELRLEAAELVGHSLGGAVAVLLAAAGWLRPASLTLLAPAGLGGEIDADFVAGMATVTTGGALAHLLRRLARNPPRLSRAQLAAMAEQLGHGRLQALAARLAPGGRQGIDIVGDLAGLASPVRLVWGLEDRIIPWTQVAAAPSRVAIHLIAEAGHMPHWDRPKDLAALLA